MVEGVLVHNYDRKEPAFGSDAAQFVENGGNLAFWGGEVPHIWIVELKKGATKDTLNNICKRIDQMRNNAACDFEGDPDGGIDEFTINCTDSELADINKEFGDEFLLEE